MLFLQFLHENGLSFSVKCELSRIFVSRNSAQKKTCLPNSFVQVKISTFETKMFADETDLFSNPDFPGQFGIPKFHWKSILNSFRKNFSPGSSILEHRAQDPFLEIQIPFQKSHFQEIPISKIPFRNFHFRISILEFPFRNSHFGISISEFPFRKSHLGGRVV